MTDWRNGATYGETAVAIDRPEKTLRGWLDRKQVVVNADQRRGTNWRRFTPRDILVLAVMARLTRFGLPNRLAGEFAAAEIDALGINDDTPPEGVINVAENIRIAFRIDVSQEHGFAFLRPKTMEEAIFYLDRLPDTAFVNLRKAAELAFAKLGWLGQDHHRGEESITYHPKEQ